MSQRSNSERELPMLAALAALIAWVEEFLALLSGPMLTFGLGIALVDLLTDGGLLASQPALLYVWAISQAAGLDAQLVGSAAKLAKAARAKRTWAAAGYGVLIVALGYVAYLASNVFATQQADGITTAQALARLGMNSTSWIVQRSALSVALVVLSGVLRYVRPAETSIEDEKAKLQRDLELEPMRQQVRGMKAKGAVSLASTLIGLANTQLPVATPPDSFHTAPQEALQQPQEAKTIIDAPALSEATSAPVQPQELDDDPPPPSGGGQPTTPVRTPRSRRRAILTLTPDTPRRRRAAQARGKGSHPSPVRTGSVEAKVRAVYRPGMSVSQLERKAGVSRSAAGKYRRVLEAEHAQRDAAAQ